MTVIPLDSRQERIARALLLAERPIAAETLAADLHLTDRVVRYNLPSVEAYFGERGLRMVKRPGVGIWTEGPAHARAAVATDLDGAAGPSVLDAGDRQARILVALLRTAPAALSSSTFEARLAVSRPTIRRDVREAEAWLEQHRLHLKRLPGVGVVVVGGELAIRGGLLAVVLESAPPQLLVDHLPVVPDEGARPERTPTDVERLVAELDLPAMRAILGAVYPGLVDDASVMTSAGLFLGILALRVREGHVARMNSGRLRSLLDHPAAADATQIAEGLHERTGIAPGRSDVAAITESLLGHQIVGEPPEAAAVDVRTIDRIIASAAERLHPSLADDEQLRASLTEHIRRLHVRLRFGLPVSNPLQQEVRRRYPDVYRVAAELLVDVVPVAGSPLPSEEIGLLTMYLAGSLERLRLRPKVRVTVVCPAGMATAWILVSRLVAEFPQIEVDRVVSKAALDTQADRQSDLIVSTIPLDEGSAGPPAIVVSPLLRDADIRRLGRAIASLPV
jgi:transcriptional antiterminator